MTNESFNNDELDLQTNRVYLQHRLHTQMTPPAFPTESPHPPPERRPAVQSKRTMDAGSLSRLRGAKNPLTLSRVKKGYLFDSQQSHISPIYLL